MNPVEAHYDKNAEREWERLDRHRTEFALTCRLLTDYLPPPPAKIIDIGGGPGRYALYLIKRGYDVTLVDISAKSLDLAKAKALEQGVYLPSPLKADARQLPEDFSGQFDAVLLLGPLYHLIDPVARQEAVREASRVLRMGGMVIASFITRFAPIRDIAIHSPQWIIDHPDRFQQLLNEGVNPANPLSAFPDSYFIHPKDIVPLMEFGAFNTQLIQGCEGILAGHEESVNQLSGDLWEAWVELNYRLSKEPVLLGASDHLLYVGTKLR